MPLPTLFLSPLRRFAILAELEFDSFRKCMTVVARDLRSGVIHVLTKGAEVAVLPSCVAGRVDETARVVDSFAADGLRTLVFAAKTISEDELRHFQGELERARQSIVNRNKFVRDVYKAMEAGFTLVGATGIEDRWEFRTKRT